MKTLHYEHLIVVTGPTATGKTAFAAHIAQKLNGEIISADSRQVYKKMDLGTGKDYEDYVVNGHQVPFHLIDIHEPGYKYNVFEYQQDFARVYKHITASDKTAILCGGTGMYIEAVTKNYELIAVPANQALRDRLKDKTLDELENILSNYTRLHNRTDTDTKKRAIRAIEIEEYVKTNPGARTSAPKVSPIYLGVQVDRELRRKRITQRLEKRLNNGMIEEVQLLLNSGIKAEDLIYYGLEYKYITQHLMGQLSYNDMKSQLNTAIHQFAKRQMTWFRKMERQGSTIHWIDGILPMEHKVVAALEIIDQFKKNN